jgi:hypothetical protein
MAAIRADQGFAGYFPAAFRAFDLGHINTLLVVL